MNLGIIHISDIHFRQNKPEGASAIINSLINDIKRKEIELRSYELFLAISGDIVFQGMDSDAYIEFHKQFDDKLNTIGLPRSKRILVPGNHDIDRNFLKENLTEYKTKLYQKIANEEAFNAGQTH